MILHTTEVSPLPGYRLLLCFNNGVAGEVDLANELDGEVFEPLRDPAVFATANQHPVMRTAVWANGADLAPEFLLELMRAQHGVPGRMMTGHKERTMETTLYQSDYYTWARQQADMLREGRLDAIDYSEHLIEELEAMEARERRELANRLTVLLTHLLKWQFQTDRRGAAWSLTIRVQRMDISDLLNDEPGLKPEIPQAFEKAYRKARLLAANETGMDEATFPQQSPYSIEQTMADDFLPEGN